MFNKNLIFSKLRNNNTLNRLSNDKLNNLYKFNFKCNFDQYKDRPKRHFLVLYKFIEDMHYKRIPYRDDHQKLIEQYEQGGSVIFGGTLLF